MAVVGIIAEYNPFHLGHAWQISCLRKRLGENTQIVVVMSGNYVQRGDVAIVEKHRRAEMAIRGGADLVLELPTPWATATAERFAQGGVSLLAATGVVTHLAFGCESGSLTELLTVAKGLSSDTYASNLHRHLSTGCTFAVARQAALTESVGTAAKVLEKPNNALAVEYLAAAGQYDLIPVALPRVGAAHDSSEVCEILSASEIRRRICVGEPWQFAVPPQTAEILEKELCQGFAPASLQNGERAILSHLWSLAEEDFLPYDGGGEGLYHRFYRGVHGCSSLEGVLEFAKTKRYPLARLRRMLLHSYLGVLPPKAGELPPYLRVLATNRRGCSLLAQMRKSATLPVVTRSAQIRGLSREGQQVFRQEVRCTNLYSLMRPTLSAVPDEEYTAGVAMIFEENKTANSVSEPST